MTSMFDQFEQVSLKKSSFNADLTNLSYFNMALDSDVPIFSKSKKEFNPSDKVTHVCISNKYLVVAMANNKIFRMNVQQPQQQDEISISKYTATARLTNIFLDPLGNHLLLSFTPKARDATYELVYISRKSNKLKATSKFRTHDVTEVAWSPVNAVESTTGPILLGTSKGLIIETEISEVDTFFASPGVDQYAKQVFDIGRGMNIPITAMEYFYKLEQNKYFIYVATPTRLYYFTGQVNPDDKPVLQQIFNCYLNIPDTDTYMEVPNKLPYSKLKFWSETLTAPDAFAWMTDEGITYGQINASNEDNIVRIKSTVKSIKYPKPPFEEYSESPITLALTQFHVLLGYPDSIKGVSLLNNDVIYEDNYNEAFGKLVNVVKDPMTGGIWAVTENAVFRFKIANEERDVWHIYCENGEFDLAKKYSKSNEAFYNQVLIKEADMLFDKKSYKLSALRYAETQTSFEETCLKFIQVNEENALSVFLQKKLENLPPQDKAQITMIVLWVVELYLTKLEEQRLKGMDQSAAYSELQREFEFFLKQKHVAASVSKNKQTIYNLMASHGDKNNLMKFTFANKDFEQLIKQHIYKNNFLEALEVLKKQNNRELFYQFSPILMQKAPKYMIKVLIEQGRNLNPVKLLPTLVSCNAEEHSLEVIRYLEYCIDELKSTEKAIHNLLVSLYAKYNKDKLMTYLDSQGRRLLLVNYDVYFALRLCQEKKLTEACVQLSGLLGLWETAVDLALEINVDLAKKIANMPPQSDVELRKKLWLKIAQHVVSGKDDIKEAMEFLRECDLIRIEDVLPFFSDFVTIDHFKEAICESLKEYNQHIQDLKEDMEDATQSAELVREEIQSFRNRYTYITNQDCCDICNFTLMVRAFYIFPCKHRFHSDCLLKELVPLLGPAKNSKLDELNKQLKVLNEQQHSDNVSTGSSGMSAKDVIKSQIDNIVASECLYCGENMIRNIDKPFVDENEFEKVLKDWL